jgi:hypothetical protein
LVTRILPRNSGSPEWSGPSASPRAEPLAALALDGSVAYNVGGGFHTLSITAFAHNDIAVGIRKPGAGKPRAKRWIATSPRLAPPRIAQLGSGFVSVSAAPAPPAQKPPSTVDVHLSDGVNDEEYLERLSAAYRFPLHGFHPELLVYVAGADPYREDQLGGLSLTLEGLKRRDRLVIETALREGTAVAIVLAGGYAVHLEDTVTIHANTAKVAKEALEAAGWGKK